MLQDSVKSSNYFHGRKEWGSTYSRKPVTRETLCDWWQHPCHTLDLRLYDSFFWSPGDSLLCCPLVHNIKPIKGFSLVVSSCYFWSLSLAEHAELVTWRGFSRDCSRAIAAAKAAEETEAATRLGGDGGGKKQRAEAVKQRQGTMGHSCQEFQRSAKS